MVLWVGGLVVDACGVRIWPICEGVCLEDVIAGDPRADDCGAGVRTANGVCLFPTNNEVRWSPDGPSAGDSGCERLKVAGRPEDGDLATDEDSCCAANEDDGGLTADKDEGGLAAEEGGGGLPVVEEVGGLATDEDDDGRAEDGWNLGGG